LPQTRRHRRRNGRHEVHGDDEETSPEGVWATLVTASDIAEAEQLATTDMIENNI